VGKIRRYLCYHCGKVFNDHTGTFYHDLRKDEQTIDLALKMYMKKQYFVEKLVELVNKYLSDKIPFLSQMG